MLTIVSHNARKTAFLEIDQHRFSFSQGEPVIPRALTIAPALLLWYA